MKKEKVRIALAQINCTVGDLNGNLAKIKEFSLKAASQGADIVVFPELSITGYPPEDLLHKPKFIADNLLVLKELAHFTDKETVIVGFVDKVGASIYNSAAIIHGKKIKGIYHKMKLPNYGVFDEMRYFDSDKKTPVFRFGNLVFGVNICEDIWHLDGPASIQAKMGAKLIFNINASPYHAGKIKERESVVKEQAKRNKISIAYVNLVGGQDELVFDGLSMIVNEKGKIISRAQGFKEDMLVADLNLGSENKYMSKAVLISNKTEFIQKPRITKQIAKSLELVPEVYQALLLGLKDYVEKNGFKKTVIGLSGGIDSALVAVLACDALGKDNVTGVFLPSRYSSEESAQDAKELAENLGIKFMNISIEQIYKMYLLVLEHNFAGLEKDVTEENLQARIRGNILMALSNKFGWLVLTTGNKSEMSTGYATLYGDMAGGFAVIKDVPKILVYKLSKYRNSLGKVIPERIITKEPTAELRLDQKDSDSLPEYEILDPILKAYIEEDKEIEKITALGFERDVVVKAISLVDKSEYKRRQAPPGIKITPKAFGRDRRMPITNKYKGY